MGMSEREFYRLSLRQFYNRYIGFLDLERHRSREEWDRISWQTMLLGSLHIDKKDREKWARAASMPWHSEGKGKNEKPLTPEELEAAFQESERLGKKIARKIDRNGT